MDRIRRKFLKISGYVGSLVAAAGISAGGYQVLINDDEKDADSGDSTDDGQDAGQPAGNKQDGENATQERTENETVEDTEPAQNESSTEVSDTTDEESTQPTSTKLDDAVKTADVTPQYGDAEFSVTGEVWNDINEKIAKVTVEVTPLDGAGKALTNDPLRDGTPGLEPDTPFFFEVRSRKTAIVTNVEDFEYAVIAEQEVY